MVMPNETVIEVKGLNFDYENTPILTGSISKLKKASSWPFSDQMEEAKPPS